MDLIFVRHGESVGNAEGRMQGRRDYPLSDRGRTQARVAAAWLAAQKVGWDAAYCSPLSRAHETGRILQSEAGLAAPEIDSELAELGAGSIEGLTEAEIRAAHPTFLERKLTELGDFAPFGGESYDDVQARAVRVVERLTARHREAASRVLVVGHGGMNFQLIKRLVCSPVPRLCILRMGNCTVTLVHMRERRGTYMGELMWHVPLELMGGASGDGAFALFR
jgi:broad specificity phosphatase PhoE